MARVTGIGGVFLRAKDKRALTAWYAEHLNIHIEPWGAQMKWSDEVPVGTGTTAWAIFPHDTKNFGEQSQMCMINYRVDDMDEMIKQLEAKGVWIDPKRDDSSYGKFAWIKDLEGNRVELWQPLVHKDGE